MPEDLVQATADLIEVTLKRVIRGTETKGYDQVWFKALRDVVLPLAARGASGQLCYWTLIGYCRCRGYRLPHNWPNLFAVYLDWLSRLLGPRFDHPAVKPAIDLLGSAAALSLELSIFQAGDQAKEWDKQLLTYT